MDTDLFFPPDNAGGPREGRGVPGEKDRVGIAKGVCAGCPVRQECLEYSIDMACWGIWGGKDTRERLGPGGGRR